MITYVNTHIYTYAYKNEGVCTCTQLQAVNLKNCPTDSDEILHACYSNSQV